MLSLAKCRQIAPELNEMPDEKLQAILGSLYGFGHLAFDLWLDANKGGSKFPLGVQSPPTDSGKLEG